MKIQKIIALMALSVVLTGCADKEEPVTVADDSPVAVSLAFML